jgi:hypothetical protein
MNLFTNIINVFLISFLLAACNNSGGVWLGEGESKDKSYTFGNQTEIETLHNLASDIMIYSISSSLSSGRKAQSR